MFSDQPVTPKRLEILVAVVAEYGRTSALRTEQLLELLQPETLPDYRENSRVTGEQTLKAARDLGLVAEHEGGWKLADGVDRRAGSSQAPILAAIDDRVLAGTDIEPYFALFYSYLLGLNERADEQRKDQEWAVAFNDTLRFGPEVSNPFNATKARGLRRWLSYSGLGWSDGRDVFQCDPYHRLQRAIPRIFADDARLSGDEFATRLAATCPELDGGRLFRRVYPQYGTGNRAFSLGVAQALIALHEDGVVILDCPRDSRGWDIASADPPNDGKTLRSNRLDAVHRVTSRGRSRRTRGAVQ